MTPRSFGREGERDSKEINTMWWQQQQQHLLKIQADIQ